MRKAATLTIIVVLLFVVGCKHKETNPKLERELSDAAYKGNVSKVKELVNHGVDVNTKVYEGHSPLSLAILSGVTEFNSTYSETQNRDRLLLVRILIDAGADVKSKSLIRNRSPLDFARLVDDDNLLEEMLVKAGADPNIQETDKSLPKKGLAKIAELDYLFQKMAVAEKEIQEEKRKIVEGKQ
jgi:ankyrin repeat protein